MVVCEWFIIRKIIIIYYIERKEKNVYINIIEMVFNKI